MFRALKLELYRAFHNGLYYFALTVACGIGILHFVMEVLPRTKGLNIGFNMDYPYSVFNSCLPLDFGSFHLDLFYYSVILLATLPYGMSYYTDMKQGYIKNICIRMKKSSYLAAKYFATFLSGALVCAIPLLLNLALTMAVLPSLIPQQGLGIFALNGECMASKLFYTHPFVYFALYLVIDAVMAGLLACLALAVSNLLHNKYIVLFVPFVIFFTLQTAAVYLEFQTWGPRNIMNPSQSVWENKESVLGMITALFVLGFGLFYGIGRGKKDEL